MPRPSAHTRLRAGFTLTELLVAIGIVAALTVAIGQIFRSISKVVSTGTAIAECDQLARTIERQLRDDFNAFRQVAPEETFLAIRMREVGDVNRNGRLDPDETAIYLTREDRDADIDAGLGPYESSPDGRRVSRAVTRRLDDMVFIASGGQGGFDTYQLDHLKNPADNNVRLVPAYSSQFARLYWGHALRPAPDPEWPPADPTDPATPRIPNKQYVPDGDFGQRAGDENRFHHNPSSADGAVTSQSRNEVAGEFLLARQQTLLAGGDITGHPQADQAVAPIGNGREYAPYLRDLESRARFRGQTNFVPLLDDGRPATETYVQDDLFTPDFPEPRLLAWGRVDICAQSRDDVQRWLEGEPPEWPGNAPPSASPFRGGGLADPEETDDGSAVNLDDVNSPLWRRFAVGASNNAGSNAETNFAANIRGFRQAIAGVFFRPLAESVPPAIDRDPTGAGAARVQPADALMDAHAVIASRCSNFEIAWTDRTVALRDIDLDSDNIPEVSAGDLIWFDITPLKTGDQPESFVRSTCTAWSAVPGFPTKLRVPVPRPADSIDYARYRPDSGPGTGANPNHPLAVDFPEPTTGRRDTNLDTWTANRDSFSTSGPGMVSGVYNPDIAGGAPIDGPELFDNQPEYFAIWPFRQINASGAYGAPVSKDILVRVRMTLHDSQMRLTSGRTYEFIFDLGREIR